MRKLFLATASVLALGLATSGAGFAAQPGNSAQLPDTSTPSATAPSTTGQYGTTGQSSSNPMEQRMQATAPEHLSQTRLKQVQQKLKDEGLYKGEIDGQMGPNTKQALERFQEKNGLQKTGQIDQQTMAALNVNNNNGTVGEGSSTLPSNQPANTNGLNNGSSSTGMNNGTSGSSTMPYNEPSNAGGLNTGTSHSNLQNGTSGTLNPATNPSNH